MVSGFEPGAVALSSESVSQFGKSGLTRNQESGKQDEVVAATSVLVEAGIISGTNDVQVGAVSASAGEDRLVSEKVSAARKGLSDSLIYQENEEEFKAKIRSGGAATTPGIHSVDEVDEALSRKDPRSRIAIENSASTVRANEGNPVLGTAPLEADESKVLKTQSKMAMVDAKGDKSWDPAHGKDEMLKSKDFNQEEIKSKEFSKEGGKTIVNPGIATAPDVEFGLEKADRLGMVGVDDLAVAKAVEDNDDGLIMSAVEFDPKAKPPLIKNRRFRLYAILGIVVAIGAIAAGVVIATSGNSDTVLLTSAPTFSPTVAPTASFVLDLRERLSNIVGDSSLAPQNVYEAATRWIYEVDPQNLNEESPTFLQRYVLALFYYATSNVGMEPWRSCNPPAPGESEDCVFSNFTGVSAVNQEFQIFYNDEPAKRWLSGVDECDWPGVFCFENQVVGLRLRGLGLSGPLPIELQLIDLLSYLGLHYNELSGTIPKQIAALKNLYALELHGKSFEAN